MRDVIGAYSRSLPPAVQDVAPTFVRRVFAYDKHDCCGSRMRVRRVEATVYGRDECYQTWHYVKQCMGGCAASYYLNKMTTRVETDDGGVVWHCFYPWTSGDVPEHTTSKSGRTILTTELLTDVARTTTRMRYEGRGERMGGAAVRFVVSRE